MDTTKQGEHFDVLIVGAGLSGIRAGYHLQQKCPGKSYVILEGRDCIGGTWDLFRYQWGHLPATDHLSEAQH
ncbi:MAG TPA: NAD(P)-binding protein [Bradyrhizobium sp.]|nr:NAD(P)-binding protein [Bradyrhizobium sp.]